MKFKTSFVPRWIFESKKIDYIFGAWNKFKRISNLSYERRWIETWEQWPQERLRNTKILHATSFISRALHFLAVSFFIV